MSREAVREILTRAKREPDFLRMMETNGYVILAGYDLTAEEIDAAQRRDLPALRQMANLEGEGASEPRT